MKARLLALFAWCGLLIWTASASAEPLKADAQRHFDAGVAYVDDPTGSKWEDAYKEFRAAYAADPNWKLMNNIGLTALNLERDGEAIEAYRTYLAHNGESDFTPKQRKQMERDIAMLSASLVRVTLDFAPGEAILIDERRNAKGAILLNQYPLSTGRASLGIHPGLHRFTIQAPGYVSAEWSFNADPSSTHQHQFNLEPARKAVAPASAAPNAAPAEPIPTAPEQKPTEHRSYTGAYIGLAATGVFAAAAAVTGVLALGKEKDFKAATDLAEEDRLKKSGETLALLTDIGIGTAVVSAGITTYLFLSAPKAAPSSGKANIKVTPVATPHTAGVAILGKF